MLSLFQTKNAVIALAFATIVLSGCSHKSASAEAEASGSSVTAEVTLTQVASEDISQMLAMTGTAAALPNRDVRVSSLVSGRLASLTVAEGDRVRAGEVLAKIDDRSYRDQLQQATAGVAQAKANLDNAKLALSRNEDLFQRGIAARKDLEDSRTAASVAEAAMRQAEATLEIASLQLARTEIRSPLDGHVVKRFVSDGEQVDGTAAQPIVEVANLDQIEFLANPPGLYLAKIHAGQQVTTKTEALPGKEFAGRVVAVVPSVDPATGVGVVRIRVPNAAGLFRMGFFMSAQIPVETHTHALTVPPEAIYRDESNQPRVFVVKGDTAIAVPVTLGIENNERVEIAGSENDQVKSGETVILTGGYGLGDKAKVQPKSPSQSGTRPSQ